MPGITVKGLLTGFGGAMADEDRFFRRVIVHKDDLYDIGLWRIAVAAVLFIMITLRFSFPTER